MSSPAQRLLARTPPRLRSAVIRHRSLARFLAVGGSCFLLTLAINYVLKLTVLRTHPVAAQTVGIAVATVASYLLNRRWSFESRGGHGEAVPFVVVSALALGVNDLPMLLSRYVLDLREPYVSGFTQETADFLSGMVLGTLLATAFRYWALKRWVFVHSAAPAPVPAPGTPQAPRSELPLAPRDLSEPPVLRPACSVSRAPRV
ncbi:GtrA family protein [Kitasatospora purpeofusca]|uniref:GtrA family protein n=1 Tax=Kitasatospora purpeofusca TaxID=67352 RepID=UPI0036D26239